MKLSDSIRDQLARFLKFGVVGVSGILVNMGILWFLTEIAGMFYLISSLIAIFISIINNFIWNDRWTWHDRRQPGTKALWIRFFKFFLISSVSAYLGNWGILWALTYFLNMHYLTANLIGIAVASILNYILNHFWTFRV